MLMNKRKCNLCKKLAKLDKDGWYHCENKKCKMVRFTDDICKALPKLKCKTDVVKS